MTKKELEEIGYWDLKKKYPEHWKKGIDKGEMIDSILGVAAIKPVSDITLKDPVLNVPVLNVPTAKNPDSIPAVKEQVSTSATVTPAKVNLQTLLYEDLEKANILNCTDNSVTEVRSDFIFSKIENLIPLMNEIHRILIPGKQFHISVPLYPFEQAVQDPMCRRVFTRETFKYFIESNHFYKSNGRQYGIIPFRHITQRVEGWKLIVVITK